MMINSEKKNHFHLEKNGKCKDEMGLQKSISDNLLKNRWHEIRIFPALASC